MKVVNLFPLSIIQEKISLDKNIKNEMIKEIETMVSKSENKDYKNKNESWTGDTQGFEYLNKNKKFKDLFIHIKKTAIKYLDHLKINENVIDLYITRSWATLSNGKENILPHNHLQSHISFAYYLKKSSEDANIVFIEEHFQNEIIPGVFRSPTVRDKGVIKEFNIFNAPSIDLKIMEDDLVMFPSKTFHRTQTNKVNNGRISISGDIVCVLKDSNLLEHIMPPIENWEKL
jgi:uncharacterized protein (TIGR02466 family)